MDKIDWIITVFFTCIMTLCFSLHSYWSFFFAGICATFIVIVNIGRIANLLDHKSKEKQWDNFLQSMEQGNNF